MTREEALAYAISQKAGLESELHRTPCGYGNWAVYSTVLDFINAAISALKGPTREQVEKVWKPCKVCNGKTTLYQHTNTTKLFMNTFGKATTLVTECNACPPYADCCMKGISANSAFRISYCPECGRPLTDEAVEMVMERMEALHSETKTD